MQLYLVRHGQSQNNLGQTSAHNVPMTSVGEEQIGLAANELATMRFDAIYCSPLHRALQTATILHVRLKNKPITHPMFSEVGFSWGEPDASREQLESTYPNVIFDESITERGWAPMNHETEDEAYERASRVIHFLCERHPAEDSCVLMVSHGRFGSILIGYLVGTGPRGYALFSQHNGAISGVEIADAGVKLRFLNATPHLQGKLLT